MALGESSLPAGFRKRWDNWKGVTCPRGEPPEIPVGVGVGVTDNVGIGVGVGLPPPPIVTRPILPAASVNQRLASGPVGILCGSLLAVGITYWLVWPEVVILPTLLEPWSRNQSAPSPFCERKSRLGLRFSQL
jgi:hypothetical protein